MANTETARPVMIVEDDHDIREAMKLLLETEGYAVATAANGEEALQVLHSGIVPCLILLDLMMPKMDGFQFRRDQLREPTLARIPVAVYSGHYDPTEYAPFLRAAAYLHKPLETDTVLKIVRAYAAHSKRAA
jgi:CheY-like chemotaxis protein